MKRILLAFIVLLVTGAASAQFSLTITTYSQDFNGLGTGSSTVAGGDLNLVNSSLNGWYFSETGASADTTITAGTGSSATGDTYNFGSAAAADRTLGGLLSGTLIPTIGFYVTNNTGAPITALAISYTGEQWRLGALGRVDRLDFQYSTDATSLTTGTWTDVNALDFTAPVTTGSVGALDGNLSANQTMISFAIVSLSIANGTNFFIRWNDLNASGADDGLGVDDFSFIATLGSSNTITTGAVSSPPFVLTDCLDTETGTVVFTSTGTFTAGNTYTAQLSDDIGSFATPTVIGNLVDNSNAGTINITIPAGTAGGTGYRIRVISDNPVVTGSSSAAFTIQQNGVGGCSSSHTDYYRSLTTGDWSDPLTWQSSPNNSNWITATLAPTYNSDTILIQNGHTVTIDGTSSADELVIQSGGILNHANGSAFTLNNGTGTDMTISSGGTYVLNGTQPGGSGTVDVLSGSLVRVDANASPSDGDDFAYGNANVTFRTGSVFEWATNTYTPEWSGRIYFTSSESPTFRFSQTPNFNLGGGTLTIIYGYLQANADLTIQGTATKTFTNGIIGTAKVDASGSTGLLIINGTTALLAGDTLRLPPAGLQISGSTVTMTSSKVIIGDVALVGSSTVVLGSNGLTVSGTISGYGPTAYIRTNGSGFLKMNGIAGTRVLPVGYSNLNAVYINFGNGADYSARVEDGINPAIAFPTYGINRTWNIFASVITAGVEVTFWYYTADANPGALPQPQAMEVLMYSGAAWSVTPNNVNINPGGGNPWTVTTTALGALIINTTPVRYALGKNGGWILPIDCIISTRAQKRNNEGIISWQVNSCAEVNSFEVQRSVNNSGFRTIGTVDPVANQTDFSFTDAALAGGTNLYRIKVNRFNGSSKYSNTVAIIYNSNDLIITTVAPNPVHNSALLTVSTGRPAVVDFKVYNMSGSLVKQWRSGMAEGNNIIEMNVSELPAGMYTLFASNSDASTVSRFVKQ